MTLARLIGDRPRPVRRRRSSTWPGAWSARSRRAARAHAPWPEAQGATDLAARTFARAVIDPEAHPVEAQVLGLHPRDTCLGHLNHQDRVTGAVADVLLRPRVRTRPSRLGADHRDEARVVRLVRTRAPSSIELADPTGKLGVMRTIPRLIEPIGVVEFRKPTRRRTSGSRPSNCATACHRGLQRWRAGNTPIPSGS